MTCLNFSQYSHVAMKKKKTMSKANLNANFSELIVLGIANMPMADWHGE